MKRSRLLRCLPLLLLVLASCSRDPKVYVDQGNKFFAKEKYPQAALMYRKALSKDARFGEAHYRLALTELKLGALGDAAGELRRARELQPDNLDARVQLANILVFASTQNEKQRQQLLADAEELVVEILAKDPNSFDGHRISGQIALVKMDYPAAIEQLRIANQIKPNQSEVALVYFEALARH